MDYTSCWVHGIFIFIFILQVGLGYQNLIRKRREDENLYSEATLEVGWLEQCLDAIKTTLSASKEETNVAQMRLMKLVLGQQVKFLGRVFTFIFTTLSGNHPSFSLDLEEQLASSRREIREAHRRDIDQENRHQTLHHVALGAVAVVNARGVSV